MVDGFATTVPLGALVDDVTVGHVGSMVDEYRSSGVPFLRSTNILPYRLDTTDVVYIGRGFHERLRKSALRPGDLVVVRTGKPGTACVIPESLGEANCSDLVIVRPGKRADARFLAYFINGMAAGHVEAYAVGAVQQHFNIGEAKRLPVPALHVDEQRAIAEVLGALDDKVELNRQMNHTLEEMASALFKAWFVDFDPVVAKAEGRKPFGMDAATAALFPSDLADLTPRGWRMASVYDIADVVYGAPFSSARFNTSGVGLPLLRIRDLADHAPGAYTDENHPRGTKVRPGDIVVGMDGEFRAHVWRGPMSWLNQRVCMFVPKADTGRAFTLLSIRPLLAEYEGSAVGTTVIHLGKADIDRFRVVHPTAPVLEAYRRQAEPWFDLVIANAAESSTLTALRDTLLPKLLSGEVRLKQAEKLVGAAL